jgi:hypothetical protein
MIPPDTRKLTETFLTSRGDIFDMNLPVPGLEQASRSKFD